MSEYKGVSSKKYSQFSSKDMVLNPAMQDKIPTLQDSESRTFLDLGCGDGYISDYAVQLKYRYIGVDSSPDMLAKIENIEGKELHVSSATSLTQNLPDLIGNVDIVFSNMLLPCIKTLDDLKQTYLEIAKVLAPNGQVIIGTQHPCFDPAIQKLLLGRENISTELETYFQEAVSFKIKKDNGFVFNDNHHTLSAYLNIAMDSGLQLIHIDECSQYSKKADLVFPKYIVFQFTKQAPN